MTLNGAITELVMMRENPMMPVVFKSSLDKVIETISECEEPSNSSESPNGWISCDEQLPEEGVIVWVSSDNEIWLLRRYGINWYQSGGNWALLTKEIDAWMPIVVPEPYQPKEDANG